MSPTIMGSGKLVTLLPHRRSCHHFLKRIHKNSILLGRTDRDPDRGVCPPRSQRPDNHAFGLEALGDSGGILAQLAIEEVGPGRHHATSQRGNLADESLRLLGVSFHCLATLSLV